MTIDFLKWSNLEGILLRTGEGGYHCGLQVQEVKGLARGMVFLREIGQTAAQVAVIVHGLSIVIKVDAVDEKIASFNVVIVFTEPIGDGLEQEENGFL